MKTLIMLVALMTLQLTAQTPGENDAKQMSPSESVNALVGVVEGQMMDLVKAMPDGKYGFAPVAAIFAPSQRTEFAGVRTFGALAIHVAQANYGLGATINGMKPDVDVAALASLKSKDQIVDALAASFVFVHKTVDTLTPDNAFQRVRMPIPGMTRLTLASFIAAHASNEYGQMVEYLRMNGIVPPGTEKKQSIPVTELGK